MRALLIYPINADQKEARGILNKMEQQAAAFRGLVDHATQVCNSRAGLIVDGKQVSTYRMRGRRANPLNHYAAFYRHILTKVRVEEYDLAYIRYPLTTPFFLMFLSRLRARRPDLKVVLEIAAYPYRQEITDLRRQWLLGSDVALARFLPRYVNLVVTFFGQEEIFGIRCLNTTNGVDVSTQPRRTAQAGSSDGTVRLLGVANLAPWHAYDRVVRGIAAHGATPPRFEFHVVGDGPSAPALRALSEELGVTDRVRFHGVRTGEELDTLYERADLALGSLGMHRLGHGTASSLKTREYCARGIPFVMGGPDEDFPPALPFVHRVTSDESPLDLASIARFHEGLREMADIPGRMRDYAEQRLTWRAKLAPVLDRLRRANDQRSDR